jgi:lysozyme
MSELIERIKQHEGFRSHAYSDSEGYLTIGFGRMIDERLGGGITQEEAEIMLRHDVMQAQDEAGRFSWYRKLDDKRKGVIVEMIFNLGLSGVLKFKNMIQAINDDDYKKASNEMLDSKWSSQVGRRAITLANIMHG